MTRTALLLALALASFSSPASAAGGAKAEEPEEEPQIDPAEAALPPTMRRHGKIGTVPVLDGIDLMDAEILARMRTRLVLQVQGADE